MAPPTDDPAREGGPPFARVDSVFRAVVDLPEPQRARALDEACGDDGALRRAVEAMLRHDARPHALLDASIADPARLAADAERALGPPPAAGDVVAGYRLLDVLGAGGMGVVYRAEQSDPTRIVALKLVDPLLATPAGLSRLRTEAALLARLEHPGIARVYQAGRDDAGRAPFIAMEFVDGVPITDWCDRAAADVRGRVGLLAAVADAVAHAHARGIVHRDLKPANVLVTASGAPKVLDFGAGRLLTDELTRTLRTQAGELVGTVPYMSPEQFGGRPERLGPASDVYSLGVLAFRLLAGTMPLDVTGRPLAEAARIVQHEEPSRLGRADRTLRGDLETIVATCLEKDPARRYPDAAALAGDLRRWLERTPITARRPSATYRARRFVARHRGPVAAASVSIVVLVAATAVATVAWLDAERESSLRGDAVRATERARSRADDLRRVAEAASVTANLAAAEALLRSGDAGAAARRLELVPPGERTWPWRHLRARTDESVEHLVEGAVPLQGIAVSADGARIAWGGRDHVVVLDRRTGTRWTSPDTDPEWRDLDFAPDGTRLVAAGVRSVVAWDLAVDPPRRLAAFDCVQGRRVAFDADGRTVHLACSQPGRLRRLDLESGADEDRTVGGPSFQLLAGPRAGRLAVAGPHELRLVRAADGGLVQRWPGIPETWAVALDASGAQIAIAGPAGVVRLYRAGRDDPVLERRVHDDAVLSLAFDGTTLLGASRDGTVSAWSIDDPDARPRRLHGHGHHVTDVVPDGIAETALVSASSDGTVRRWDRGRPANPILVRHDIEIRVAAFSPDGRLLAVGTGRSVEPDGRVHLHDAATGAHLATLAPALDVVADLAWTHDGSLAAAGRRDVAVWEDLADADPAAPGFDPRATRRLSLPDPATLTLVDVGLRGVTLATTDGAIDSVHLETGARQRVVDVGIGRLAAARWIERDGAALAVAEDGTVARIDARTRSIERVADAGRPGDRVTCTAVRADSTCAVLGFANGRIVRVDLHPERRVVELVPAGGRTVREVRWSPDGRWLLAVGEDRRVKFRDPDDGRLRVALGGHDIAIAGIDATGTGGGRLVTWSADGTVRIWRAE